MAQIASLECSRCHHHVSAETPQTVCPLCSGSLYVRYDLDKLKKTARREDIAARAAASPASHGMWRYSSVLPDVNPRHPRRRLDPDAPQPPPRQPLPQGRGRQPHRHLQGARHGHGRHHGQTLRPQNLAAPAAGNAAGALAAYCRRRRNQAHIFMPQDVPIANYLEGVALRSQCHHGRRPHLRLRPHGRRDIKEQRAEQAAGRLAPEDVWFDISTLKEPFRVEGKKTMGYELVEQLGWAYPDAVFYPTGGGVGLIGMWKAFEEMEALGWVEPGKRSPKRLNAPSRPQAARP